MSYEGYVQCICAKGHLWHLDCYQEDELGYMDEDLKKAGKPPVHLLCPVCKSPVAWRNGVDQTNCDEYGYVAPEIDKPAVICKCDKCGIEHVVEPPIYKIPSPDAREKAIDQWVKDQEEKYKDVNRDS